MSITTPFTEMFDLTWPIALAPMGQVAGGRLAAAVTDAGGLGLIGGGYGDEGWLEREFRAAGNRHVGVGFITWSLARAPELLDRMLSHRPSAVMLSFGDAAPFVSPIKQAGSKLICQVQSVQAAEEAAALGADVIVAQGAEAGGHGCDAGTTLSLVPAVVDRVAPLPVLAAGGIGDGRGLAAALMLGAAGALIGTRFYASAEALGHEAAKRRIVGATAGETLRTTVFDIVRGRDWPAPYNGRAIANAFAERWHGREGELSEHLDRAVAEYRHADEIGDVEQVVVFAGEGIDLIRDVAPAGELVARIGAEALAALARGGTRGA